MDMLTNDHVLRSSVIFGKSVVNLELVQEYD